MARSRSRVTTALVVALAALGSAMPAAGQARVENQVAVFAALDKITARISRLEIPLGQAMQFGAFKVIPRACYSRPPTEQPKTTTFVEVEETQLDGTQKRIFAGWMFAESPGLNAVEHPVFDVWLTECSQPRTVAATRPGAGQPAAKGGAAPASGVVEDEPARRRRPPR